MVQCTCTCTLQHQKNRIVFFGRIILTKMSFSVLNFLTLILWSIIFLFVFQPKNILYIILYSEITWVSLYSYTVVVGSINDDVTLTSTSFFLLALAGLEFCLGFLIVILFRSLSKTLDIESVILRQYNSNSKTTNM